MSDDLVTIITPATEFEANVLAIVLKDNGIEAFVFATPTIGIGVPLSGGTSGVPLQVARDDVERAKQILHENKRHSIDIDWEELSPEGSDEPYRPSMMHRFFKVLAIVVAIWMVGSFLVSIVVSIVNFVFAL
ncbi:MAG: DUF2007 domain-containing protein [Phycisphaerales bacterium]|nr:DUF2007 domain-containing protein [Phycisphaerales bacterium]